MQLKTESVTDDGSASERLSSSQKHRSDSGPEPVQCAGVCGFVEIQLKISRI